MWIYSEQAREDTRGRVKHQPSATPWVRFGGETLFLADEAHATPAAMRAAGRRMDVTRDELHVVIQNGRLFQQHHADVPVIHDRGRYLLVKLDPARARNLATSHPTCYAVRPLAENEVVFDALAPSRQARAPAAFVQEVVNRLQVENLRTHLTKLASFHTRHSTSAEFGKAATWARQRLNQLSYQTRTQTVSVGGKNSRNVIADKPGAGSGARSVVIVTAHLDSINLAGGPSAAAPGADDNGSGSVGVLEIARVLQDHRNVQDLRLILFGGEEQGLFGSTRYVASLASAERARIRAIVNMDMIATLNAPSRTVLFEGANVSQTVIDELGEAAAAFTQLAVETSLNPAASDHVPFINAGLPAVLVIEGADGTNHNVHSARDSLGTIDFNFFTEILRGVTGFVANAIGRAE